MIWYSILLLCLFLFVFGLVIGLEKRKKLLPYEQRLGFQLFNWVQYRALIFDKNGRYIGIKAFSKYDNVFDFHGGSYNIKINEGSYHTRKTILHDYLYYYYELNNPDPIKMGSLPSPIFSAQDYNIFLNTKLLKDLNNVSKDWLKYLTPTNIFIALLILFALWFIFGGGFS